MHYTSTQCLLDKSCFLDGHLCTRRYKECTDIVGPTDLNKAACEAFVTPDGGSCVWLGSPSTKVLGTEIGKCVRRVTGIACSNYLIVAQCNENTASECVWLSNVGAEGRCTAKECSLRTPNQSLSEWPCGAGCYEEEAAAADADTDADGAQSIVSTSTSASVFPLSAAVSVCVSQCSRTNAADGSGYGSNINNKNSGFESERRSSNGRCLRKTSINTSLFRLPSRLLLKTAKDYLWVIPTFVPAVVAVAILGIFLIAYCCCCRKEKVRGEEEEEDSKTAEAVGDEESLGGQDTDSTGTGHDYSSVITVAVTEPELVLADLVFDVIPEDPSLPPPPSPFLGKEEAAEKTKKEHEPEHEKGKTHARTVSPRSDTRRPHPPSPKSSTRGRVLMTENHRQRSLSATTQQNNRKDENLRTPSPRSLSRTPSPQLLQRKAKPKAKAASAQAGTGTGTGTALPPVRHTRPQHKKLTYTPDSPPPHPRMNQSSFVHGESTDNATGSEHTSMDVVNVPPPGNVDDAVAQVVGNWMLLHF